MKGARHLIAVQVRRLADLVDGGPSAANRTNAWIETYSGRRFDPLNPTANDAPLDDIAQGLSQLCRYNGQTSEFYSVAEHCVLLAEYVKKQPWSSAMDALTVLHHDDPEALIGDLVRPLKRLWPLYAVIEHRLSLELYPRLGIPYPHPGWVKELDGRIIVDEHRQAFPYSLNRWAADGLEPLGVRLQFWAPKMARVQWRALHYSLVAQCRQET